jgi:ribonuclease E
MTKPAIARTLLISANTPHGLQVSVVEDGRLAEKVTVATRVAAGNIYLGIVKTIEPSIQSAFVDIGLERNGFLHVTDIAPFCYERGSAGQSFRDLLPQTHEPVVSPSGKKPPIQEMLRAGQALLVQVIKQSGRNKGSVVSTYLSLGSRYWVAMPWIGTLGVSKTVEEQRERHRLATVAKGIERPAHMGLVVRKSALHQSEDVLTQDATEVFARWGQLAAAVRGTKAPALIYNENNVASQLARDWFDAEVTDIWVDDKQILDQLNDYLDRQAPAQRPNLRLATDLEPLYKKFDMEAQIECLDTRHVPLANNGVLVFDRSESISLFVVKAVEDHASRPQGSFLDINRTATTEIARQIRLRNLGGLIGCAFLGLADEGERELITSALKKALQRDRAQPEVLDISKFGLAQVFRNCVGQVGAADETVDFRPIGSKAPIFISYRQDDSLDQTGRIYDWLVRRFGAEKIFMDLSSIPKGVDFERYLEASIKQCIVILVPIGKQWLDAFESRKKGEERDWVHFEIATGLRRGVRMIPLFLAPNSAALLNSDRLPQALKKLAVQNGMPVRSKDFHSDIKLLIDTLEELGIPRAEPAT